MKRNKIASLLLGACLTFSATSCNDWLDVIPQAQVSGDKIFSTTDGYESVLYGIYISMTEANTYGCNLTFGLMDVLAQYYTTYTNKSHLLYEASLYNYENGNVRDVIDNIWLGNYNTIANCNILLENSLSVSLKSLLTITMHLSKEKRWPCVLTFISTCCVGLP